MDTAIHEDPGRFAKRRPGTATTNGKKREACEKAGVTAILGGVGFDPGVVNAYVRLAEEEYLDTIEST